MRNKRMTIAEYLKAKGRKLPTGKEGTVFRKSLKSSEQLKEDRKSKKKLKDKQKYIDRDLRDV